jgi:LysM repeat protein
MSNYLVVLLFAYASAQPPCRTYNVKSGDVCFRVAGDFKTTVPFVTTTDGKPCPVGLAVNQTLNVCPTPNYPPTNCSFYIVKTGEWCGKIAQEHGTTVGEVTEGGLGCPTGASGDGSLQPGDQVLVCNSAPPAAPTPAPGPTPKPVPPKPLPAGCKDYKVVAGDECYRIAGKTETTFDYLFKKVGSGGVPCDTNLNVGDVLAACPTPNYPPKECSWYKVKGGDSCTTIATAYNSNNITEGGFPPNGINCDSGNLKPGDELLVCGGKPPGAH